jgi:hypothetical protein
MRRNVWVMPNSACAEARSRIGNWKSLQFAMTAGEHMLVFALPVACFQEGAICSLFGSRHQHIYTYIYIYDGRSQAQHLTLPPGRVPLRISPEGWVGSPSWWVWLDGLRSDPLPSLHQMGGRVSRKNREAQIPRQGQDILRWGASGLAHNIISPGSRDFDERSD